VGFNDDESLHRQEKPPEAKSLRLALEKAATQEPTTVPCDTRLYKTPNFGYSKTSKGLKINSSSGASAIKNNRPQQKELTKIIPFSIEPTAQALDHRQLIPQDDETQLPPECRPRVVFFNEHDGND
jgi:hypothetical protein